jgi:hypothetical protein
MKGKPSTRIVQDSKLTFNERKVMLTAHTGSISRVPARKTNKRLLATLLACAVAVMVAIAVAATAHGQGVVSPQPWCMVSAPQPQMAERGQMQCIQPRAFLPLVMEAK